MTSISPTRVVPQHRKPAGYLIRVSARAGGSDDRDSSPRAGILSIRVILPANQSTPVTSFERVISGVASLARVAWGRTVERSRTIFALRFVPTFSRIRRDIRPGLLNSVGAFKALRSLSSNALVQFLQEPASSIFHRLTLAPVLSPVPVLHASNRHQKDTRDHGNSYPQHG
jgi:hypothetical protein